MRKLLIVDDEINMQHMLKAVLQKHGYAITLASSGEEALEIVQSKTYQFILCDVRMKGMSGLEFLEHAKSYLLETTVIMMSAYGTVELAIEAMQSGAYDYISKPFKNDEVILTLKKAEEREELKKENLLLKEQLDWIQSAPGFGTMVGVTRQMIGLFELATKVAPYDTTVTITGESGTGKELLARGIHQKSPRSEREFFAINCATIPENLLESELFGFVRGAFTGATDGKRGILRQADKSTLFLDEIGELPLLMQTKLLRVIQEREVRPLGGNSNIKVDVRLLAATAKDLKKEVAKGNFREDLYFRLNVVELHIPPLRDRKEDLRPLVDFFIKKINLKLATSTKKMSTAGWEAIMSHDWPGNVRELENAIERAVVLSEGEEIDAAYLPRRDEAEDFTNRDWFKKAKFDNLSLKDARKKLEAKLIQQALAETGGNKRKASQLLELSYPSLLSKIKEYGLNL